MGWRKIKDIRKKRRLDLLDSGWQDETSYYDRRVKKDGGIIESIYCFNDEIYKLKYNN